MFPASSSRRDSKRKTRNHWATLIPTASSAPSSPSYCATTTPTTSLRPGCYGEQSTATASAAQTCRIRSSANRPTLSTRTATDTLSNESRLTAQRRGIGSAPGSRTTSLASPRIVVVHGATTARRSLGIAASRDSTMTGRRPISDNSHHHTSPRFGIGVTRRSPPSATSRDRPTRRADQPAFRRRRRSRRRSRESDSGPGGLAARRPPARHRSARNEGPEPLQAGKRRL